VQALSSLEVRIWYRFTESIGERELSELSMLLSDDERARSRRFMFMRDRRDFTAAHALVRRTLSLYADRHPSAWKFDVTEGGKPALAGAQGDALTFNLSHTHGLVACAIARETELGVDVESINRINEGRQIAERFFSPLECRYLETCEQSGYMCRFIELWTLKESYLKGSGVGLAHPLGSFSFAFEANDTITFNAPPGVMPSDWQFVLAAPAPGYRLAVAVRRVSSHQQYRVVLQDADISSRQSPTILATSDPNR
jgi:4'-phosphopantetheinyl transferase